MNKTLKITILTLHAIYSGAQIKSGRNPLDLFSDRIRQAATEPTLLAFVERLQTLVDASPSAITAQCVAAFVRASAETDAPSVLGWVRQYPKITAMLAGMKDSRQRDEAIDSIEITSVEQSNLGTALPRRQFHVGIDATCLTPLAHGGDAKAGNATLFRRMNVLSTTGQVLSLPFYSGNALRGMVRDALADYLLFSLGLAPRRDNPPVALWFFHTIYAGGALADNAASTKAISVRFGKAAGALRTDGLREFRDLLPSVSLLGCALGNRVLCGRVQFGDLRPRCKEWGNGSHDVAKLFEWTYLTRREDLETHDEHSGMIATTETLKAGVLLEGGIDIDMHCQPIERSALARGLLLVQQRGRIGAENRRDLGGVEIKFRDLPDPALFDAFLIERKDDILKYLAEIKAINAPGTLDCDSPVGGVTELDPAMRD